MNLFQAQSIAEDFIAEFGKYCQRIEVAGSVRRKKLNNIKDIEIVIIPYSHRLSELKHIIRAKGGKFPSKHTSFHHGSAKIDLYVTDAERWGCIFLIRTGSSDFNKALMKYARDNYFNFRDGRLYKIQDYCEGSGIPLETFEEEDVFKHLDLEFVEPERRKDGTCLMKIKNRDSAGG